jgi:hypothetical protein
MWRAKKRVTIEPARRTTKGLRTIHSKTERKEKRLDKVLGMGFQLPEGIFADFYSDFRRCEGLFNSNLLF